MEDEDGEGSNINSWTISEQLSYKDATLNNKTNNVNDHVDDIEENKEETSPEDKIFNSKNIFKGFKKRILAQTQESEIAKRIDSQEEECSTLSPKTSKDKSIDGKRGKITEYAQYLGLQPAGKYKCPKCNPIVTFRSMSMLMQHQCVCTSAPNAAAGLPSTSEQHGINTSTNNNFRISRKVYLCAACGTYFENWNLFLHMREIHKRHICLFCLGMFGQAERLSHHLMKKHSVPETQFHTVDDFYAVFKGSCYLICCTCEKVFSETDNFHTHDCVSPNQRVSINSVCSVCRQTDGTHLSTCKLEINFERKNTNERIQASDSERTLFPNPANAVAKKLLGVNRAQLETSERALLSSYNRKLLDMYSKKISLKLRRNSKIYENDWDIRGPSALSNTAKITLAMHSSKYDSERTHDRLLASSTPLKERHIVEIDVTKSPAHERIIDRYTDTIMQVSRCNDELMHDDELTANKEEEAMEKMRDDEEDDEYYDRMNSFSDSPENIEQGELILDDGIDDMSVENIPVSPNRTNFTPTPKSPMRLDEQINIPSVIQEATTCSMPKESPSRTVSRVNSTNRSLIIKICTNKNSQFSVATPNGNGSYETNGQDEDEDQDDEAEEENDEDDEDHEEEEDCESEENNNAGQFGSEKEVSVSDHASDSETGKLTVKSPNDLNYESAIILGTTAAEGILTTATIATTTATASVLTTSAESLATIGKEKIVEETLEIKETTASTQLTPSEPIPIITDKQNVDITDSTMTIVQSEPIEVSRDKLDQIDSEEPPNKSTEDSSDGITLASDEVQSIDLNVSGTLDSIEIDDLLKLCIKAASPSCIYCNHARHIAVNGKQLALHMLAEHRFQPQHPAIIIQRDQFNVRVKKSLDELTLRWFNLDSYDNTRGTYNISAMKTYECYLCRICYTVHKELYLHNRKMHQKTILICIMCKSTFYSHSELLCHLCPGVCASHINIKYRCCLCPIESLPSAFRLMVHLRKRHHACDVCLESTGNQQRLSNHVWKHKLHHLCYRCGIAYRNKPDITKHLFWKHGTESILCKKCLQKKWPHIYHFCIPPSAFACEECGSTFSRAVALKVHKRLHSGDEPYSCTECSQTFISKRLLSKHEETHIPLSIETSQAHPYSDGQSIPVTTPAESSKSITHSEPCGVEVRSDASNTAPTMHKDSVKKVLDVYDLPPLNLSSDSDSDTEDEKRVELENKIDKAQNNEEMKKDVVVTENIEENISMQSAMGEQVEVNIEKTADHVLPAETNDSIRDADESNEEETKKEEVVIMNGIWDNFKSYTASLESKEMYCKTDNDFSNHKELLSVIAAEHDYCTIYGDNSKEEQMSMNVSGEQDDMKTTATSPSTSITAYGDNETAKRKTNKSPKKKTKQSQDDAAGGSSSSSDSSSDSDSSSCSCGTNCSCSSSSSGSSSSSSSSTDSDSSTSESSPKKSSVTKKDRRKDKDLKKNRTKDSSQITQDDVHVDTVQAENGVQSTDDGAIEVGITDVTDEQIVDKMIVPLTPAPLRESDLETDETETDEDFYDEYPQQHANKLLAEKRNQLMLLATVAPQSADDSALGSSSNDTKNGTIDATNDVANSLPESRPLITHMNDNSKRKIKTKRRKKGVGGRSRGRQQHSVQPAVVPANQEHTVESIKLNIPKFLYRNKQTGARKRTSSPNVNTIKSCEPKLPAVTYQISQSNHNLTQRTPSRTVNANISSNENESANENKRSSKRKRVPKKFYGDSSDEEQQRQQNSITSKWRRIDSNVSTIPYVPSITIKQNYGPPSSSIQPTKIYQAISSAPTVPEPESNPMIAAPISAPASTPLEPAPLPSVTDSEDPPEDSSSESSTSEIEQPRHPPRQHPGEQDSQSTAPNRQANLYCYCQCPYDEVSEMIACDGSNCRIEWFHFECVGIMVPPKGKWYCPDCSKRDPTLPSNEYFD